MSELQNPVFHNETEAREWLEAQIWPDGPVCPHCGSSEPTALKGKTHRPGLYQCNDCRQQFTVTVGTLFERSKIPLSKWLLAIYLLSASKKGPSTRELSRMLGVSVKSSWFMMHRIREAINAGYSDAPTLPAESEESRRLDRLHIWALQLTDSRRGLSSSV